MDGLWLKFQLKWMIMDDLGVHFRKPSYANIDFLEGPSLGFD